MQYDCKYQNKKVIIFSLLFKVKESSPNKNREKGDTASKAGKIIFLYNMHENFTKLLKENLFLNLFAKQLHTY